MRHPKNKRIKKVYPKIGRKSVKSDFEYQCYKGISNLLPSGATVEYEVDKIPYVIERVYNPDFTITKKCGTVIYIESKGYFDAEDRQKHLAVRKLNPDLDIRFVFYNDGKIHKMSTTRYSDWCTKNSFKFAIRQIPQDLFEE